MQMIQAIVCVFFTGMVSNGCAKPGEFSSSRQQEYARAMWNS